MFMVGENIFVMMEFIKNYTQYLLNLIDPWNKCVKLYIPTSVCLCKLISRNFKPNFNKFLTFKLCFNWEKVQDVLKSVLLFSRYTY